MRTAVRSRENTRERLLEAAVDVFVDKGLKRVTVDDLVAAAGFTRGAFYSNFSSVDEVFLEVFRRSGEQMLARAGEFVRSAPVEDFDVSGVRALLESFAVEGTAWLVLHHEFTLLALRDERARGALEEFSSSLRAEVVEVLGAALVRLGRRATVPAAQLAETVLALQFHGMTRAALRPGRPDRGWMDVDSIERLLTAFSEPVRA